MQDSRTAGSRGTDKRTCCFCGPDMPEDFFWFADGDMALWKEAWQLLFQLWEKGVCVRVCVYLCVCVCMLNQGLDGGWERKDGGGRYK